MRQRHGFEPASPVREISPFGELQHGAGQCGCVPGFYEATTPTTIATHRMDASDWTIQNRRWSVL